MQPPVLTEGTLLDGRVRYRQPATGHRTGIEPVLLAAAVPARAGDRVLEAGTGAGAGLLCLAARVPGVVLLAIEADPATAAIARGNFAANALCATVHETLLPDLPDDASGCAHAFANPPWHDPGGTAPVDPTRRLARQRLSDTVATWTAALSRTVVSGGSVTLIVPAGLHHAAADAFSRSGLGAAILFPLWPRAGREAKLVLLQARRARRTPPRILPGLVLHREDGTFTAEAEAILRAGEALRL